MEAKAVKGNQRAVHPSVASAKKKHSTETTGPRKKGKGGAGCKKGRCPAHRFRLWKHFGPGFEDIPNKKDSIKD